MNRRIDQDVEEPFRDLEWYREDLGRWLEGEPLFNSSRCQREIIHSAISALGPNPYEEFCITCENRMGFAEGAYCTVVWNRKIEQWLPEWEHVYCHQAKREQQQNRAQFNSEVA